VFQTTIDQICVYILYRAYIAYCSAACCLYKLTHLAAQRVGGYIYIYIYIYIYMHLHIYIHICLDIYIHVIVSDLLQAWRIILMFPVTSRGLIPLLTAHGRDSWARWRTGFNRRSDPMSGTHGAATTATTNYRTMGGAAMAVHGWSRHHRKTSRSRISTGEGLMHAYVHHMHNTIINKKQSSWSMILRIFG